MKFIHGGQSTFKGLRK